MTCVNVPIHLGGIFDFDLRKEELEEVNRELEQPGIWDDPENAQLLETIDDINAYKEAGLIDIGIARPMDSDHIVNCPFIDPFQ